jgi:putative CocE/NonD family hydrolase
MIEPVSLAARVVGRVMKLPAASTHAIEVERDLEVSMPDGAVLLTDRYAPRDGGDDLPIVLVRSPYGRSPLKGLYERVIAERGYQVVSQSCRGTFGSTGTFRPFQDERDDGVATLEWLAAQPWYSGKVAMYGASYGGFTQWAAAAGASPERLTAIAPQVIGSQIRAVFWPRDVFGGGGLEWCYMVHYMGPPSRIVRMQLNWKKKLGRAYMHLPLREADRVAVGTTVRYYQQLLEGESPDAPVWDGSDHGDRVVGLTAPVLNVTGWYDFSIRQQIADYHRLRDAGKLTYLTVGPWPHSTFESASVGLRESLAWFDAHLRGQHNRIREQPVRAFVMGADRWVELPDWPPPSTPQRLHLQAHGRLAAELPLESPPDQYRYDPADPTPVVGGEMLRKGGRRDQRKLEARPDVLIYTTEPLESELEVAGTPSVELYVRSSVGRTDFYAKLCVVSPKGRSFNVCEGLVRLHPDDGPASGTRRIVIDLSPTHYAFQPGDRIRLQVSSGAHPHYMRNLGTGEPIATARTLRAAEQEVFHDPGQASALVLPVVH